MRYRDAGQYVEDPWKQLAPGFVATKYELQELALHYYEKACAYDITGIVGGCYGGFIDFIHLAERRLDELEKALGRLAVLEVIAPLRDRWEADRREVEKELDEKMKRCQVAEGQARSPYVERTGWKRSPEDLHDTSARGGVGDDKKPEKDDWPPLG